VLCTGGTQVGDLSRFNLSNGELYTFLTDPQGFQSFSKIGCFSCSGVAFLRLHLIGKYGNIFQLGHVYVVGLCTLDSRRKCRAVCMATCALLNFDFDNGLSRGTCSDLPQTAGPAGPRTGKGPFSPIGPGPAIFAGPLKH
jgi:hypothetical protein